MKKQPTTPYWLAAWSLLALFAAVLTAAQKHHRPVIFTVGDSTMADKTLADNNQERGWAMMLAGCLSDDVVVENHATNGRSTKSFIDEGRWQKVVERLQPGDYVLIEFGHNDAKQSDPKRFADAETTFRDNLRRFVRETRERGATPVLLNAVVRRKFVKRNGGAGSQETRPAGGIDDEALRNTTHAATGEEGDSLVNTHGRYSEVPREVAGEMNVAFIDATAITFDWEQRLGPEGSRHMHMNYLPGEHPVLPQGRNDNTHYNIAGARAVANMMADQLGQAVPALRRYVRHYDFVVSKEGRGDFFTVQEAVDAAPAGKKTTILVGKGAWEKPVIAKGKKIKFTKRRG